MAQRSSGSSNNNRYDARRSYTTPSNPTTQSMMQTRYGANQQDTQGAQPAREPNPFRAMVQLHERPRTLYVTFSVDGDPMPVQDVRAYIDGLVGEGVGLSYYMDMENRQGWIVLSHQHYVEQLLGEHWIGNKSMVVKRFVANTRRSAAANI